MKTYEQPLDSSSATAAELTPLAETSLSGLKLLRRGKVRDVFEIDQEYLLIVATDRISAFDCVLPTLIPRKGEVLTALSEFWFRMLQKVTPNHLVTTDVASMPDAISVHRVHLQGRSMMAKRVDVFPIECVIRGYLAGSGWRDYRATGSICGHKLPRDMSESDRLPEPLFTPSTKAEAGHDENISEQKVSDLLGRETTRYLRETSLRLYQSAEAYASTRGIIIADTKFEFGLDSQGEIVWIDEALTPDSSRFWPADRYRAGGPQPSFDKQFVRDYLESLAWNKRSPAPPLPPEIAAMTASRYLQAYSLLAGKPL